MVAPMLARRLDSASTRTVSAMVPPAALDEARRDCGADPDQDQAAEKLSPLSGPRADLRAQLQADQRQGDADAADDRSGHGQADVELAEREPDSEVIDADRQPDDDQAPGALPIRRGSSLIVFQAADGLEDGPGAGGDEQAGADPAGGVAQSLRQAAADREPGDRHAGLEQAEDDADLQPGPGADAGDPDADRGGEVRQADGHRDQDQGEHIFTVVPGPGPRVVSLKAPQPAFTRLPAGPGALCGCGHGSTMAAS